MDRRRRSLIFLGLAGLAQAASAAAPGGRSTRIGYLAAVNAADGKAFRTYLVEALRRRGYVEGANVSYEWRYAEGDVHRLDDLAADLAAKKADVIIAAGTPPTLAARKATELIPIISVGGASPVTLKLAASLSRPGGNVTGVPAMAGEVIAKGVEVLHQIVPNARRIGWLMNPDNPASMRTPAQLQEEGKQYGIELVGIPFTQPADLDRELGAGRERRVDALYIRLDAKLNVDSPQIAAFALSHRIPAVGSHPSFVPAGGLASFGQSYREQWDLVAEYVDRIANGAKAADMPIILPTKFELSLNRKTAAALGITLPPALLLRADVVVE